MIALSKRLALFCQERFPLLASCTGAALLAACVDLCGQRFVAGPLGNAAVVVDARTLVAAVLVFLGFFVVRGVDEIRDLPGDQVAHPERPLPRGAVRVADVAIAVSVAVVAAVAVAASVGAGFAAAAAFGVSLILQLDGGLRSIARRPLLSLLGHQLIVPVWVGLVLVVRGLPATTLLSWPAVLLGLLAASLALLFEVGRKVHHHDDENVDDDSYSQRFGTRPASLIAAALAGTTALLAILVGVLAALPVWTVFAAATSALVTGVVFAAYAAAPAPGQSPRLAAAAALTSLFVYLPLVGGALLTMNASNAGGAL